MTNAGKQGETQSSDVFAFVPSYNHAPFIEECLRSIFAQTKSPKKLLVIDDGSKDDSPAIIERVLKECPFDSELIVRENRGLCRTLNEGLELSAGEYFAYISSDDLWLPKFLASRTSLLDARTAAVLVYGHAFVIDEDNFVIDRTDMWGNYVDGAATEMLLQPTIPSSASVVYRRSFLIDDPWHKDALLEDYDMYLRLSVQGDFALDEPLLSAWRIHGSNTSSDHPRMLSEWLRAQTRLAGQLGLSDDRLSECQRRVRFAAVATLARNGYKAEAAAILSEIGMFFPFLSRLKMRLRVAIPKWAYILRRNTRRLKMRSKFGKFKV